MIPVNPEKRTTLVLDSSYQAYAFFTARAAVRHLMNGSARGLDAAGVPVAWNAKKDETYAWSLKNVAIFEDQPCLRSAGDNQWPIPTIMITNSHFGFRPRSDLAVTLKTLYSVYRGTCQYCLEKIPYVQATKDHAFPRSKGGTNHSFNLVLACRRCNNEKDSIFPYYNVLGEEVKPRPALTTGVHVPPDITIREEWKTFLFMN